ncbi:MAG: ABC transporter ATP-binding protein [Acidobacteriota bacterium]
MAAIRTLDITRSFKEVQALDRLSFEAAPGEIFGLVGPDGAGKTTTMRILAGIMRPDSGEAWILDRSVTREPEAVKDHIGYLSQRFGLYPDLTVQENIRFYADIYGVPRRERETRMADLLAFSDLSPFKRRRAADLSGGMKQKLALACALIHTPRVLLLDEPTNGVDPISRRDFWKILYRLMKEGVTILVSTAYLDEAERCSRVGLIHKGRLLAEDTPAGIKGLVEAEILEVELNGARNAADLLKREFGADAVGLFGDRVHVESKSPADDERKIRTILRRESLPVTSIRSLAPSLEDVFLSVMGSLEEKTGDE